VSEGFRCVSNSERTVLSVASGVLGELDVEVVLERVVHAARELTSATYAALGILADRHAASREQIGLARFIAVGIDEQTRAALSDAPRGLGVLGELIRNPEPLRLEDVSAHPHSYGFPAGHPPMRTFLGVPVFVGGRPFGNLYLTEKAGGEQFTLEDEEAVVMLAELAGVAIENARRYTGSRERREELERTVAALEATTQVTRAIGDETDVDVVLELVAKRGRALVQARVLLIELCQDDELLIAAGAGEVPGGLVGRRMLLSGTFAEQAVGARGAVRVEDEVSRARFNEVGVGRLGVQAQAGLVVPLLFQDRSYGALLAIDRLKDGPAFSAEDARLLEAFAASAATAVAVAHTVAADIERLAAVVRSSPDAIGTTNVHGVITSWNPGSEQLYGYTAAEMVGQPGSAAAKLIVPEARGKDVDMLPRVLRGEPVKNDETSRVRKDGTHVEISLSIAAIRDPYGRITGVASVARDITEQKQTQRILSQTERLESIGQLAGGVAHDMNNLLTIILNHLRFALDRLSSRDPVSNEIAEAQGAAERAATLVRQLLLFAREDATRTEVLDLNDVIGGLLGMLTRTLGEHIVVRTDFVHEPRLVCADRGQVEQVIVNLAVNARDAMPQGGILTVATSNVTLSEQQLVALTGQGQPGEYLCVSVSDTGSGMTPEVIAKALDPFFTTKPAGSGTGLGLASVYGILRKASGHLHIASELGAGTTIETYWPLGETTGETLSVEEPQEPSPVRMAAGETILLVEDEQLVRRLATRILQEHGYTVLEVSRPSEAKAIAEQPGESIDLMITDVVMPEIPGIQLAALIRAMRPELPVLYTSGYMPNPDELPPDAAFLAKPFSREQLLAAVASTFDAQQAATGQQKVRLQR
jgi:two-component system cell cycle sensor histidine kinase/response regulator CckA